MLDNFHFLHPWWLAALAPLALLFWLLRRREAGAGNPWRRVVDAKLLPLLLAEGDEGGRRLPWRLLALGWLSAVLALADPAWEKRAQPVFQSAQARVILMDLSASMNAADLAPSRLVRARLKVADVLARQEAGLEEGRNALVVFAGDAFIVSPLTRDGTTIEAMLRVLEPSIMPVQGSRVDIALAKAGELLQQAGAGRGGEVLLLTDGIAAGTSDETLAAARELRRRGHRLSVLGVGTPEGAPVPTGNGRFLRDSAGNLVVPRLDPDSLRELAQAGGGRYATLSGSDSDLAYLLGGTSIPAGAGTEAAGAQGEAWIERGPWLTLLLLPLAAVAFRRGWLLGLALLAGIPFPPPVAMAVESPATQTVTRDTAPGARPGWEDLWLRPDQQAAEALERGDAARAVALARDPMLRGAALYRQGDYARALEEFSRTEGADAAYNRGNALARLGRYREAIAAYDEALQSTPAMEDALANKSAVEELLRRLEAEKRREQESRPRDQQGQGEAGPGEPQQGEGAEESQGDSGAGQGQQGSPPAKGGGEDGPRQQGSAGNDGRREARQPGSAGTSSGGRQPETAEAAEKGGKGTGAARDTGSGDNQFARAAEAALQGEEGEEKDAEQGRGGNPAPEIPAGDQAETGGEKPEAGEELRAESGTATAKEGKEAGGQEGAAVAAAEALTSEEQMAAEQWLRRIPDDPGGLLRRKFLYQYRQRAQAPGAAPGQDW